MPFLVDGHTLAATASVGSALHSARHAMTVSELFMHADMALYDAKRHGKARHAARTEAPAAGRQARCPEPSGLTT
ncbi:hypothetical protein D3C72_2421360 [compost metagenome]